MITIFGDFHNKKLAFFLKANVMIIFFCPNMYIDVICVKIVNFVLCMYVCTYICMNVCRYVHHHKIAIHFENSNSFTQKIMAVFFALSQHLRKYIQVLIQHW
jgi:hypothetical protein